jgi:hypothetical protein
MLGYTSEREAHLGCRNKKVLAIGFLPVSGMVHGRRQGSPKHTRGWLEQFDSVEALRSLRGCGRRLLCLRIGPDVAK